jgi:biotin carboxylase
VLKPKDGRGSIGVTICSSDEELELALLKLTSPLENYELEEFVNGYVSHIDGVVRDGVPLYSVVFRSIGTPFEYAHRNMPSGEYSLEPTDPQYQSLITFAHKTLSALALNNSAFHLEVIEDQQDGICFLEVGARPGGGFTTQNITMHFGYQIIADDLRLRIGESLATDLAYIKPATGSVGDLMFPVPLDGKKYRVHSHTRLLGAIPEIFEEHLPEVGSVLHGDPSGYIYVQTAGTFRFQANSQDLVAQAIQKVAKEYKYKLEIIGPEQ